MVSSILCSLPSKRCTTLAILSTTTVVSSPTKNTSSLSGWIARNASTMNCTPNPECLRLVTNRASMTSPVRFSGSWKRFTGVGAPRHDATRVDVLVSLHQEILSSYYHYSRSLNRRKVSIPTPCFYYPVLTLEKRGRLPHSQTKYLPPAEREVGELEQMISMPLGLPCVDKILSLDGITREIIQLTSPTTSLPKRIDSHVNTSPADLFGLRSPTLLPDPISTTNPSDETLTTTAPPTLSQSKGQIGMQDGFMFLKLETDDNCLLAALPPGRAFLFRHLLTYAITQPRFMLPLTPFIHNTRETSQTTLVLEADGLSEEKVSVEDVSKIEAS